MGVFAPLGGVSLNGSTTNLGMRVQTSFEKMAQRTEGKVFIFFLIAIRLLLGVFCLYAFIMGMGSMLHPVRVDWGGEPPDFYPYEDRVALGDIFGVITVVGLSFVGVSFILGLLVRPASIFMMVIAFFVMIEELKGSYMPVEMILGLVFVLLLGLFSAGGAGHIFGLDGIIFRNVRTNRVTKFLFG